MVFAVALVVLSENGFRVKMNQDIWYGLRVCRKHLRGGF